MTSLDRKIYALESIRELVGAVNDMKKFLHEYDYQKHDYIGGFVDENGAEKSKILDDIVYLLLTDFTSHF